MTKLEELLKWMDDAEYAPSYGELREKIKQLITEEHQVKNCDLADVVLSEERTELDCFICNGDGGSKDHQGEPCDDCSGSGKQAN